MTAAQVCDGNDSHHDREPDEAASTDPALEGVPAVGQRVPRGGDGNRPGGSACGIVKEERRPSQPARAGEQGAEDAQAGDEPCDEDGAAAVAPEEPIELIEPRACEAEMRAVTLDQAAAVAPADQEPEVVAEDRGADRRHDHP